jgi:hypothetical protein
MSSRQVVIQVACGRCTQGVMDADNPHYGGRCTCPCHYVTGQGIIANLREGRTDG